MSSKPGPFVIINARCKKNICGINSSNLKPKEEPILDPFRRFECDNYEKCLTLTAKLDWDSFTCKGCNGSINAKLLWRARKRKL